MQAIEITIDKNLKLRGLNETEASELFTLVDENRDYFMPWLPWVAHTQKVDDSRVFINKCVENRNLGTEYSFGIFYFEKLVGHISLMNIALGKIPEIGYWVAKTYAGMGFATKASMALIDFAKSALGINEVLIAADMNNQASNKVAQKVGGRRIYEVENPLPNSNYYSVARISI